MSNTSNRWIKFSNIGVKSDMPNALQSRIRVSNQATLLASIISILYFSYEIVFLPPRESATQVRWFYLLHLTVSFAWVPVFLMNRQGWHFASRLFVLMLINIMVLFNSLSILQPFRSEFYFFVLAAFSFVVFDDLRIIIPMFFLQATGFLLVATTVLEKYPEISGAHSGLVIRVLFFFTTFFFILFFMKRETTRYEEEIEIKNNQLLAEHNELEKQNFTKDKIFSIISHDLRSPVASLHSLLGLLSDKHVTEQEFKKATLGLESQVEQLRFSLDELLVWSKSQLKGINPQPQMLKLKSVIKDIIAANIPIARRKKLIMTSNIPDDLVTYCDSNMLISVISVMPWTMYGQMEREDLAAIYTYLKTDNPISNSIVRFTPASK